MTALRLIRTEYLMPDVIPVQYGIAWITQPFKGDRQIVVVLEVALHRLPYDLGPAPAKRLRRSVQRLNESIGQPCCYLAHAGNPLNLG